MKETIKSYGPIDITNISSVSKRVCIQCSAYLLQFNSQQLLEVSTRQIVEIAEKSIVDLQKRNSRLSKQVAFLGEELRKIRDGEAENISEMAANAIITSMSIRKEKKLTT